MFSVNPRSGYEIITTANVILSSMEYPGSQSYYPWFGTDVSSSYGSASHLAGARRKMQ